MRKFTTNAARLALAALLLAVLFTAPASFAADAKGPLYIFMFIGDGMGMNHYLAAQARGLTKSIESLPVKGEVTTLAFNKAITDSAAAATALATGEKTREGMLGLDAKGKSVKNVTEAAAERGMGTGIISSMSLNHATPAGFYAHIKSRTSYYDIGLQLIASGVNYFGGGGFHRHQGRNKDMRSLYELAEDAGYQVFRDGKIPNAADLAGGNKRVISVNPALRSDSCMPYAERRAKNGRALSDFLNEAIQVLSDNELGFFIMTEGGNIDYAAHDNQLERMLGEISDLDGAVSAALDFYHRHPDDTLIIVMADHNTGGLSLNPVKWSTRYHTRANVPLFAIGKGSGAFRGESGTIDNTAVAKTLFKLIENTPE